MPKYMTVVYAINDDDAFEPTRRAIIDKLKKLGDQPFAVTAVSLDNEMVRIHWMEQAAENIDDIYELRDTINNIISHADIDNVSSLDELRSP